MPVRSEYILFGMIFAVNIGELLMIALSRMAMAAIIGCTNQKDNIRSKEGLGVVDFTQLLDEKLMLVPLRAVSREEAFAQLAQRLQNYGYVKDSYFKAVLKREKTFPTGLCTGEINVALPHTDVEHVLQPGIAVGVLEKPVRIASMDNPQREIDVSIIFMLALKNAHDQPKFLEKFAGLFENKALLHSLATEKDVKATYRLLLAALSD